MTATGYANLTAIPESATLGMTARAAALAVSGRPVVALSAGEPDFDTPRYIADAGIAAIREGRTHYPPAAGLGPLRAVIAQHLNAACGGSYGADEVLVSVGAKQALFEAVFTLFGPGDRVVVPAPYWVSYPAMIRLARAEPEIVETGPETGFKLTAEDLDAALARGARGVILNSPANPTGAVYTLEELEALLDVAASRQAWVISDEIYREIRYTDAFASVAPRAGPEARIVLVDGFSKAYAMTGWRVGYAAAAGPLISAMARLQGHVNTNTSLPSQHAALAALTNEQERLAAVTAMRNAFARRRTLLLDGLRHVVGLEALVPDGAFYLWIDARPWCAAVGGTADDLCLDLLEHEALALVPGTAFGVDGWLRLSFAASEAVLVEALERLAGAARRLGA